LSNLSLMVIIKNSKHRNREKYPKKEK